MLPATSGVTLYPTPFRSLFQAGKPRPGGGGAVFGPMGVRPAPSQSGRPGNRNPQPCKPPSHGVRRAAHCVPARATCAPAAATLCACCGTSAFPGREWGTGGRASGSVGLSPPCPCLSFYICWSCFGPSPRLSAVLDPAVLIFLPLCSLSVPLRVSPCPSAVLPLTPNVPSGARDCQHSVTAVCSMAAPAGLPGQGSLDLEGALSCPRSLRPDQR